MIARLGGFGRSRLGRLWWVWGLLIAIGVVTNFGTAALRLQTILPSPQPVDFGSYYVSAWAMRLGESPYYWSPESLRFLEVEKQVVFSDTYPNSPPAWIYVSQAFTVFSYPAASWVWLAMLLVVLLASTSMLVRIAGHPGWKATWALLPFTLTFGSTFLNLTIGQNALFILLAALLVGRHLAERDKSPLPAATSWVIAVAAKVYPLLWLVVLPFLRRMRLCIAIIAACGVVFAGVWWLEPGANRDYWFRFLPGSGGHFGRDANVDDQSIVARVALLGRTSEISFAGMDPETRHERVWRPPLELPMAAVLLISFTAVLGLGAVIVATWIRAGPQRHPEGLFYLLVLFTLLPIPHMERYNHVAVLPAMAWLWGRGGKYRYLTVLAYCLVGLSRLNHLWAILFPWPLGPLATGTCMYAVVILGGGIAHLIWTGRP